MANSKYIGVDRNNNPKSPNYHKWYVCVAEELYQPMKTVFIHEKKSECIKYAKELSPGSKIMVSNGVEYGARF